MIKCPLRRPSAQENKIKCPLWDFPFSHAVSEPLLCWFAFPSPVCVRLVSGDERQRVFFFFFFKCVFRLQLLSSFAASSRASAVESSASLLRPSSSQFCFYSPKSRLDSDFYCEKCRRKWNVFFITELAGQHLSIYLIILLGEKCVYSSRWDDLTSHLNPATATPNFHFHVAKRVQALWTAALIAVLMHFHYLDFFLLLSTEKY